MQKSQKSKRSQKREAKCFHLFLGVSGRCVVFFFCVSLDVAGDLSFTVNDHTVTLWSVTLEVEPLLDGWFAAGRSRGSGPMWPPRHTTHTSPVFQTWMAHNGTSEDNFLSTRSREMVRW